jgi:hypothetical protein
MDDHAEQTSEKNEIEDLELTEESAEDVRGGAKLERPSAPSPLPIAYPN